MYHARQRATHSSTRGLAAPSPVGIEEAGLTTKATSTYDRLIAQVCGVHEVLSFMAIGGHSEHRCRVPRLTLGPAEEVRASSAGQ